MPLTLRRAMDREGLTNPGPSPARAGDAKAYHRTLLTVSILSTLLSLLLLVGLCVLSPFRALAAWCSAATPGPYAALLLFGAAAGVLHALLALPLAWYGGYRVEHAYALSTQSAESWVRDRLKGMLIGAPLAAATACLVLYCLGRFGDLWWLPAGIALSGLSVLFALAAPLVVLPLFHRCTPLAEGELRSRIVRLAGEAGVKSAGVFTVDMSRRTRKANAALTGFGRTRRILLGDTLLGSFTDDEVETVFAHELGHMRLRHIPKRIIAGTAGTMAALCAAAQLYGPLRSLFGMGGPADLASLPALALSLSALGLVTSPIGNIYSRRHERQADAYAVRATGKRAAFASALAKLASMNLADPAPHPAVEFFFYSHPAVARRLRALGEGAG